MMDMVSSIEGWGCRLCLVSQELSTKCGFSLADCVLRVYSV